MISSSLNDYNNPGFLTLGSPKYVAGSLAALADQIYSSGFNVPQSL